MHLQNIDHLINLFSNLLGSNTCTWQKMAENAINGFFTMIGIAFAAWLAYLYAIRQRKKEIFIGLEQIKYRRKLEALEGCWKLLVFTTESENQQVILTWEKEKGVNNKTYFFHPDKAEEFITNLAAFHYSSGLGIYMPKTIKELLFEYRSIIYGTLQKEQNKQVEKIKINNTDMVNRMTQIHQMLITELKNETEVINKQDQKNKT
jgi:hypothetical protein